MATIAQVAQLLNVAYGMHEISAEHADAMLAFLRPVKPAEEGGKAKTPSTTEPTAKSEGGQLSDWKQMHADDDEGSNDDENE